MMTKEELEKKINDTKFQTEINCFGDDKFKNLISEVYYAGMREGYELAKFRLNLLNAMPLNAADDFLKNNMDTIRSIRDMINEYENMESETGKA